MRLFWAFLLALPSFAATVAVAPQSLSFAFQQGAYTPTPPPQAIVLTSPGTFSFTISRPAADSWLVLGAGGTATLTAQGPVFVGISANPLNLGPGTYRSVLTVRVPDGTVTIPVTLLVSLSRVLYVDPSILFFDPGTPVSQLTYYSSDSGLIVPAAKTSVPWLSLNGPLGRTTVAVDLKAVGPALSAASIEVTGTSVPFPANSPVTVPVVVLGSSLASPAPLTPTPASLSFTGSGTQQVTMAGPAFTASADAKWVSTTVSGQTLTVTVDATGLDSGSYLSTITLNAGGVLQALPVSLALGPVSLTKVVNGASWAEGAIAPGEVVVLGGANLGPSSLTGLALDKNGFVSSTLAGVQVTFGGVPAPLVYVSAGQVAAVAPYELDGQTSTAVQVTVNGRSSNALTIPVAAAAPGVFTANASGTGPAASFRTGDTVSIYVTGEGQTNPPGMNGLVTSTPPLPRQPVTVTLDGQPVTVTFAGEAPGIVSGVAQVNFTVPATARAGDLPLVVTVGGVASQSGVTVSVR